MPNTTSEIKSSFQKLRDLVSKKFIQELRKTSFVFATLLIVMISRLSALWDPMMWQCTQVHKMAIDSRKRLFSSQRVVIKTSPYSSFNFAFRQRIKGHNYIKSRCFSTISGNIRLWRSFYRFSWNQFEQTFRSNKKHTFDTIL